MTVRALVSTHLSNAVAAALIYTLYNIYTTGIADPLAIGVDFISYLVPIFIGLVVITPILDTAFDRITT